MNEIKISNLRKLTNDPDKLWQALQEYTFDEKYDFLKKIKRPCPEKAYLRQRPGILNMLIADYLDR